MNMAVRFPAHPEHTDPQNDLLVRPLSPGDSARTDRPEETGSQPQAEPHWSGHWAVTLYL